MSLPKSEYLDQLEHMSLSMRVAIQTVGRALREPSVTWTFLQRVSHDRSRPLVFFIHDDDRSSPISSRLALDDMANIVAHLWAYNVTLVPFLWKLRGSYFHLAFQEQIRFVLYLLLSLLQAPHIGHGYPSPPSSRTDSATKRVTHARTRPYFLFPGNPSASLLPALHSLEYPPSSVSPQYTPVGTLHYLPVGLILKRHRDLRTQKLEAPDGSISVLEKQARCHL